MYTFLAIVGGIVALIGFSMYNRIEGGSIYVQNYDGSAKGCVGPILLVAGMVLLLWAGSHLH